MMRCKCYCVYVVPVLNRVSIYVYRSVFFTGQIERAFTHSSLLLGHSDRPVTIAINTEGLHIIRQSSPPVRSVCNNVEH